MKSACALLTLAAIAQAQPLAFTHVTVIDTQAGRARPDMTVVVSGDRIASVGPSPSVKLPRGAHVVEGRGKFLIPGLWDMHVHMRANWDINTPDPAAGAFYSPNFVANGITGVRGMWDGIGSIRKLRADVASGAVAGPRVVASGNMLDGPQPSFYGAIACSTPEQGREAVARLKRDGSDFIKVYSGLAREVYLAIAGEAKKCGLPFAGHVPNGMSAAEASDAGQKSIEHLLGVFAACSSREDELARGEGSGKFGASLRAAAESYDDARAAALFARFGRNGTSQCPTLTALRSAAMFGDAEFMQDDRIRYLPPLIQRLWKIGGAGMSGSEDPAARRRQFERDLRLVGAMHRAGVKILAGTDTPNPYVFPGDSLHDELQLLVKAGLTPVEALQSATLRPAEYVGMADRLGAIAPGKLADLVLLERDPLADIANTRTIQAVVLNGRLHRRAELDRMLENAREAAAKAESPQR